MIFNNTLIIVKASTCLALLLLTWHSSAAAFSSAPKSNTRIVKGAYISVHLPIEMYTYILEHDPAKDSPSSLITPPKNTGVANIEISLIKRKELGGTQSDAGWVCHDSVSVCATADGTQNYWLDEAANEIRVGGPTEPVRKTKLGAWIAYEAFPLCGWASTTGRSSPYLGQCYAVVLSSDNKTVSFQILLGRNTGCHNVEKCWAKPLARIRQMMHSIE